jgi:hypothetical protein
MIKWGAKWGAFWLFGAEFGRIERDPTGANVLNRNGVGLLPLNS